MYIRNMCAYLSLYIYIYIYIYIYGGFPDSMFGNGCGAETEESIPCGSKQHRGYIEESIPPCVRIASGYVVLTRRGMFS